MTWKNILFGLSIVASPLSATQMTAPRGSAPPAPPAPPEARYCLRVDPPTGSRIETIRCETRDTWADLGVDVDQEWAQWGVRIVGPALNA